MERLNEIDKNRVEIEYKINLILGLGSNNDSEKDSFGIDNLNNQ